jgi:hypothetical protein
MPGRSEGDFVNQIDQSMVGLLQVFKEVKRLAHIQGVTQSIAQQVKRQYQ